jgi:hypothetical protein
VRPHDEPPDGQFEAILYDLDCLPSKERQTVLDRLLSVQTRGPVGVHSYHLDEVQTEALSRNGVVVTSRLEAALLHELRLAAHSSDQGRKALRSTRGKEFGCAIPS